MSRLKRAVLDPEPLPALTDLEPEGYACLAEVPGARRFTGEQVRRWVLQRGITDWESMTDLSRELQEALSQHWRIRKGAIEKSHVSKDGTVGITTRLEDGEIVESVSIPEGQRRTLCLSSQVGCAVKCTFCASGLEGLIRNLSPGEIIEQIFVSRELPKAEAATNYVFMGSGEPTHNLNAVLSAIRTMNHPDGLGIGARRITVSTVGNPAALEQLAEVEIPFNIALSLHSPHDASRLALMPGLGSSDLQASLQAALRRFEKTGRRITAEVVLMKGVNDSREEALALANLLADSPVLVNLIPWNRVDDIDLSPPDTSQVTAYATILKESGVTVTTRRPRGQDVGVACGQLRRRAKNKET